MCRFVLAAATLLAISAGARAEEPPICTDRPTKANAVCTVPAGKWQLESSAAGWSQTQSNGVETKVLTLGSSVLKVGLSKRSDLQIGFTPYIDVDSGTSRRSGIGDVTVRYKHRLTGDDSSVQLGLIPFVKLPTAKLGIGDNKVEGGLAAPISMPLGKATLVVGPEIDLLADSDGKGRHLALVNLVNVAGPVAPRLTLAGEIWTMTNFDPTGTITLASADAALAYAVSPTVQLDLGANFGLTRHTADKEFYVGASFCF